jgi:hypothetical protein
MTSPTPARVSGPGALSQRTDGGQPLRHIADAKYGEDKANIEQQKMAPLGNSADQGAAGPGSAGPSTTGLPPGPVGGGPAGPAAPPQAITPFGAPSTMPDQHVTAGAQFGPPPPPKVEIQPNQLSQSLAPYFAADTTGVLADLAWKLSQMGL